MRKGIVGAIDSLIYLLLGPFTVIGTVPLLLMRADAALALPHFTSSGQAHSGFAMMNIGAALALWCTWLMRRGGGTPIPSMPATRIVRSGPYAYVRHPMMHSLLIVGIGELLVTGSLLMLLWIPLAMRAGVLFVDHVEEPLLKARFGQPYVDYCQEVSRWWPRRKGTR